MSMFIRSSRPLFARSSLFQFSSSVVAVPRCNFAGQASSPGDKARWYVSRDDVAKHNSEEDAWIIVHGKVYDVTDWLLDHPGGSAILKNVGKDSTELFESIEHSEFARKMLGKYYIADLVPAESQRRYSLGLPIGKGAHVF